MFRGVGKSLLIEAASGAITWNRICSWGRLRNHPVARGVRPKEGPTMPKSLPHAFFRHPDGSWYRLWMTHSEPKTPRGHPWHVHANYDKSGSMAPVAGVEWYEQPYGIANWDFDSEEDARA